MSRQNKQEANKKKDREETFRRNKTINKDKPQNINRQNSETK